MSSTLKPAEPFTTAVLLPVLVKAVKNFADIYRIGGIAYIRIPNTRNLVDLRTMSVVKERLSAGKPVSPDDIPTTLGFDNLRNIKEMKAAEQRAFLNDFQDYLSSTSFCFDSPSLCRAHGVEKLDHVSASMLAETFGGIHGLIAHLVSAFNAPTRLNASSGTFDMKQSPVPVTPTAQPSGACAAVGNSKHYSDVIEISDSDNSDSDDDVASVYSHLPVPQTPVPQAPVQPTKQQPAVARSLFGGVVSAVTNALRGSPVSASAASAASVASVAPSSPMSMSKPKPKPAAAVPVSVPVPVPAQSVVSVAEDDDDDEDDNDDEEDDIYVITANGKSAHRGTRDSDGDVSCNCRYVRDFIRYMTLAEAQDEEWPLCKTCCVQPVSAPARALPASVVMGIAVSPAPVSAAAPPSPRAPAAAREVPLYGVAATGGCYHYRGGACTKGADTRGSPMEFITKNEAEARGKTPCGRCRPLDGR